MRHTRLALICLALCHAPFTGLSAQSLNQDPVPAEFPPSSFSAAQYVDSTGCVFIRAGVDGVVTWVPRVTRDRRQVCGQTPSLGAPLEVATTPVPQDVELLVPGDAPDTSAPQPQDTLTRSPITSPQPRRVQSAPASAVVAVPLITDPARADRAAPRGDRRILPSHLVESRAEQSRVIVPDGFEPVWTDGRLNPQRGEQSIEGYKQSQRTLTLQLPRREVGDSGPKKIKEPRVASNQVVQTGRVQFVYGSAAGAGKAERALKVPADQLFVQVVQHRDPVRARADAERMARTGIPTRIGQRVRRGQRAAVQLVLAGPFTSRDAADKAVQTARRAGFPEAVVLN